MDTMIAGINPAKKSPGKEVLWNFIKESLKEINEINESYKKLYEGVEDKDPIIQDIENKYQKIKENYDYLFSNNDVGINRSKEIQNKINEIKKYHNELLIDSEGEESIKSDIEDSKKHITEFYNYLFDSEQDGEKTNEEKIKDLIDKISGFGEKLFGGEKGIEKEINEVYNNIISKHSELFKAEEGKNSIIQQLDKNINNIRGFKKSLDDEIKPGIDRKQKYLDDMQIDIDTKRKDIKSLLSSATLGALTQGYQESKEEYSEKKEKEFIKWTGLKGTLVYFWRNINIFFYNVFFRHFVTLLNYFVFIFPLLAILVLFVQPKWAVFENFNEMLKNLNGSNFQNYIFFRLALSLPLVWISWFGQRNISQRKRLHEEYNHKLRVVQMYRMFNDNSKSYNLDNKIKLERILLDVIGKNPGIYLGKGETIIDQILEKFRIKGFYKELKDEMIGDLRPVIEALIKGDDEK